MPLNRHTNDANDTRLEGSHRGVAFGFKKHWNPHWNPHWIRVAEEDEAMKIGPWVARKRKAFWEARFAVAVANCNAYH